MESEANTEQRSGQLPTVWPSNRGLPTIAEWTATTTENQPAQQSSNNIVPRITVNPDRHIQLNFEPGIKRYTNAVPSLHKVHSKF